MARVLILCECSGVVREAFRALGHDAWSCDLVPSEQPGPHIIADAQNVSRNNAKYGYWDLMIHHSPCTFISNSSAKHLYLGMRKENGMDKERWRAMAIGAAFFRDLQGAPIPKIAGENPIMLGYAQEIIGSGPSQIIQPYDFGEDASKFTCLWLKNLPPLIPTKYIEPRIVEYKGKMVKRWGNQSPCGADNRGPSPTRAADRARTYQGIAQAMAEQWGAVL